MKIRKEKCNKYDYNVYAGSEYIGTVSNQVDYWEALTPAPAYNLKTFSTMKEGIAFLAKEAGIDVK